MGWVFDRSSPKMSKRLLVLAGWLLLLAVIVTACGGDGLAAAQSQGFEVGKQARDLTLKTLDGGQSSLSDYRGKVVVLNFWATWCPPCRAELPDFEQAHRDRQGDGLVVLGINTEEPAVVVRAFVEDIGLTFPILLDETGQVAREYRAAGLPMTLVIDREGLIQVRHVGYLSAAKLDEYLSEVLGN
jgi:peroxiredoxin